MLNRRSFLQSSPLIALSSGVPQFLLRSAAAEHLTSAEKSTDKDARVLVVIEMDGGNDLLNTIVPFADATYASLRPNLKLDPARLVKLNDSLGLHYALRPLVRLWQAGQLAAIPGIGYPNPNRSHFESMAIWQSARFDPEDRPGYGWLGQALDPSAGNLFSLGDVVPAALRGRRSSATACKRLTEVLLEDQATTKAGLGPQPAEDLSAFLWRQSTGALDAANRLAALAGESSGANYPQTELGERLKLVARLLKANVGARVFYTQQTGYDTHSQQFYAHARLLGEFAEAVAAFFADLAQAKLADRVALFSFSEFGRTIRENGSAGTDHGTAGASFVAGPKVKGGVLSAMPSLTDLESKEPKMTIDFRSVYASLLEDWLGLAPVDLGGTFKPAPLFRS